MSEHRQVSDDELFDTLGAADAMHTGAPPVSAIVERGRRARRRMRAAALAGAAAAVVAVVGGLALVSGPDEAIAPADEPDSAVEDGGAGADGPVPAPPDGMRWVAKGGLMVAVPADWSTNVLQCARTPLEDTVIVDPGPRPMCQAPRPEGVASVDLRQDGAALPGGAEDLGEGVRRGAPTCEESGACTTLVRAEGVTARVVTDDAGLAEEISASARPVPEGAVVVPARKLQSRFAGGEGRAGYLGQLRRAGLGGQVEPGLDPSGTFAIEPPPGSVVPEGSTVQLARPSD